MVVQKPENVLRRAEELIAVGQNLAALQSLHEIITSKRSKSASLQSLEPIMVRFVELCVNLRKGKMAKEGLYQFKNIAQNTNVSSIEMVFKRFIELAEGKVTEAQAQAQQQLLEAIDDLEASETPESVMLSTVSSEQNKDRTDRAVVTPWLKFLWETYRTVLEILRNNARLEQMYQTTAHQAFTFCRVYTRKTEFRRLCDLLRNHLQNVAKYSNQPYSINLNDPDTLQRHLDTRFNQLNVAADLELWQEAFRAVEDIHSLISMSKRPPKNVMMANYYERLTRIFLVSDNYLFVAAAWNRYYNLLRSQSKPLSEAEQTKYASFVLLSALAIPVINSTRSKAGLLEIDDAKHKQTRLAVLLSMGRAPSRAFLLKEASSKAVLSHVRPEIRELYNILEVEFHPLSICKKIEPVIAVIAKDPDMAAYVKPLHQVILTRLFQQLSQVYESLRLDFVMQLASFPAFEMNRSEIEKFIMSACKKGELSIRLDHASQLLTFESDVFITSRAVSDVSVRLQSTPSDLVRTQLSRLSKTLYQTVNTVDSTVIEEEEKKRKVARDRAVAGGEKEHQDTLARRAIIERRRELVEIIALREEREQASKRAQKQQQEAEIEQRRQAEELRKKEQARMLREKENIKLEEAKKLADELLAKGVKLDEKDLVDMDTESLRRLQLIQLDKERGELHEKMRIAGKRIDHFERALRREEIPLLNEDYQKQLELEKKTYEENKKTKLALAAAKHQESIKLKRRLERMLPDYNAYRATIKEKRSEEFETREREARAALEAEKQRRRAAYEQYLEEERRAEEERQREEEAERERLHKEEEERIAKEEAARKEAAERTRIREEERRKQDEILEKQRQREKEAEENLARRRAQQQQGAPPAPSSGLRPSPGAWRPRRNLDDSSSSRPVDPPRTGGSRWGSDRPTSNDRFPPRSDPTSGTKSPSRTDTPPAPAPGRYVPPARRS